MTPTLGDDNLPDRRFTAGSALMAASVGRSADAAPLDTGQARPLLQEAFVRNVASQCGYCTPGQIMAAKALLLENPQPSQDQIAAWMSGNICRCGAYAAIAKSIREAADTGKIRT